MPFMSSLGPVASDELSCGLDGQSYIAATALAAADGSYLMIQCICSATASLAAAIRAAPSDRSFAYR